MYELIQVSPHNFYIDCPAKVGLIVLNDTDVCLIDSGSDKDSGRRIRQILDRNHWHLTAIYNTHSHADHIGGNHYLQAQTGCSIYANGIEQAFTCSPVLEPSYLFGASPIRELRHKFLMAEQSTANLLTPSALPEVLTAFPLPGHSFDMVGFRTDENTVYLADCLTSEETLSKYGIPFLVDVRAYLETLEQVVTMQAACFIPAHAPVTTDIAPLARLNIQAVQKTCDTLVSLLAEPLCFDVLLSRVFETYGLKMTHQQHALVGSTVRSYLTYLNNVERIQSVIDHNMLFWQAVKA
ncbi:MAG: MBL fold metallo-hydrolase [Clostridia bacterium]|nr:MBL fold metallo-hydrolase [Clostridia bacterium]